MLNGNIKHTRTIEFDYMDLLAQGSILAFFFKLVSWASMSEKILALIKFACPFEIA